jgi:hypothetical protein
VSVINDLRSQAMELGESERALLARDLLLSLDRDVHEDARQAWALEIQSRSDAVARGEFTASDWRKSVDRIRTVLAQRRSS